MAKDLFSTQTLSYAKYRPTYPRELFEYILGFVENREAVWDCGTGNGQAARVLAEYFQEVKATDISEKQLAAATAHPNIEYILSSAENTHFIQDAFDLITVAQAYHWFNFKAFEQEVIRVGKTGSIIAIWGYNLINTPNEKINNAGGSFYTKVVGPYWDPERKYVEENYDTVPFNFPMISSKMFSIESNWSRDDLSGYLQSWSAVQNFIKDKNYNPVDAFANELSAILKQDEVIPVSFPVFLKVGLIK